MWGHFPAAADGNDLIVFTDDERTDRGSRASPSRASAWRRYLCIADFFRSVDEPRPRLRELHARDHGAARLASAARSSSPQNRYSDYLLLHGLGVEMAEALAELWHHRIRDELGYAEEDGPTLTGLFRQQYRGGRYSWGYPACPDLTDNAKVADAARARAHRRDGLRGLPAAPRADDRRHHLPPPDGEVLRRLATNVVTAGSG